jgi:uncharacterized protein DUF6600/FecR-like protein
MKTRFLQNAAILTLALAGVFCLSALAQTTDEGTGPSEQPSAPMEVGTPQGPPAQPPQDQTTDQSGSGPQEAQPGGPSGEEPAKTDLGVARISMIHGDVSTQRGDSGDWSAATLNQPVMGGDKVSTADNARAELQLDFANILRLGANSQATLATLTHKDIQIQLSQGLANYTVSKDSEAEPEIDTPNVSVHPAHHDGVFRIEVRPDGDTIIIVRKGEAQIATPQGSTEVRSGQMATVRGTTDSAQYKISDAPEFDDWDRWNSDRDHLIQNAQAWHHTNRNYTGAQDLDAYGRWKNVPDYGDVWVPDETDDWAPYRDGNWVYEPYYGWTWVGYEPWGWAPYHYGRWFWYDNAWAWWPGPIYAGYNPFWAPAYVSFWGWGWGAGFGWGWGGYGWLPVGPCDWYHPWWGGYRGRFGTLNVVNVHVTNINRFGGFRPLHGGTRFSNINHINDVHVSRGISTLNGRQFGAGGVKPVAITRQQLNGARLMTGNLPVVPTHASLSASGRPAAPSTIRSGSQRFFGSAHNNVARPESFERQTASLRSTMQQNHVSAMPAGGRINAGESSIARGTNPTSTMQKPNAGTLQRREMNNSPVSRNTAPTSTTQNRGGFRPFTPPSNSNPRPSSPTGFGQRATTSTPPVNRGGFRPFTPPSSSPTARSSNNSYWNRTAPSSVQSRSYGSGSYGGGSRPQLDMRQPIVRSPSYGGYSRPSYGGYGGRSAAPSYSAPRGSYGGGHSAPSYGGSRGSYGGGGGGHSYGGGGGGHSSGGGGGHSSGGGGGHSGGGGGGHASGGGGHSGGHR